MTKRILVACVVCLLAMSHSSAVAQDDPMDVLKPFVGTWTTTSVSRPSLANPEKSTGRGEFNVRTMLGGRFIQSEGYITVPRIGRQDYSIIMTYDERQKAYRRWLFRSDGLVAESRGVWDAEKKTMTWSTLGLPANATFTVTTTITDDGFQQTLFGKRADGAVTMDVTSTSKRKR